MSPQMITCPGCRSRIRFNEKSGRTELKCPRCRKVFGISQTGSVSVQQTLSMPTQRAKKEQFKETDSQSDMPKQRNATPAAEQSTTSGGPRKVRRSAEDAAKVRADSQVDVSMPKRASIIARPEVRMFLLGLVTALVVGFSGLTLFVALRPEAPGL